MFQVPRMSDVDNRFNLALYERASERVQSSPIEFPDADLEQREIVSSRLGSQARQ
jgi:hypothetical protein